MEGSVPLIYEDPGVNPFVILVVGLDRRIENTVRTDVIILVFIDSEKGEIKITNIPRDLMYGRGKINSVYGRYGIEGLKKAVKELTGIQVNGYAIFDYESFRILGDELGPITIEVKNPMIYHDYAQGLKIEFKPGIYEVNGDQLLAYIRYRKGGMGDLDRIERQKYVLKKLLSKALSEGVDVITKVYSKLIDYLDTDLSIGKLIYFFLKFKRGVNLTFLRFPYDILVDGRVVIDRKGVEEFKAKVLSENEPEDERVENLRFLVLNNSSHHFPSFLDKTKSIWKDRYGKVPKEIFWEKLDLSLTGSHLVILSKHIEKIVEIAKKVYPNREFRIHKPDDMNTVEIYYRIVSLLSKRRMYPPIPLDAIFIVGDLQKM